DIERVLHDMQERRGGFQFEVIPIRDMPGFESAADSLAVKAVSEAYGAVVGQKPKVGPIQPYMFMTSDSGHMQSAGMADGSFWGLETSPRACQTSTSRSTSSSPRPRYTRWRPSGSAATQS